jgi:hypothetical protein
MAVTGSGVIFSPEGYVVTNNHVVERAERVTCFLEDQQEVPATVVGRDPETGRRGPAARPHAREGKLPYAELGDSSKVQVGEHVMAMGSPLGLARSVSFGVVSSIDRYLPEDQMPAGAATGLYNTWIQTDAAINPGNSGGPAGGPEGARHRHQLARRPRVRRERRLRDPHQPRQGDREVPDRARIGSALVDRRLLAAAQGPAELPSICGQARRARGRRRSRIAPRRRRDSRWATSCWRSTASR